MDNRGGRPGARPSTLRGCAAARSLGAAPTRERSGTISPCPSPASPSSTAAALKRDPATAFQFYEASGHTRGVLEQYRQTLLEIDEVIRLIDALLAESGIEPEASLENPSDTPPWYKDNEHND
jgi:hypothetical protein